MDKTVIKLLHDERYWGQEFPVKDPSVQVICVPTSETPDIVFKRYTLNWARTERPFVTFRSHRRFATLESAVRAILVERMIG